MLYIYNTGIFQTKSDGVETDGRRLQDLWCFQVKLILVRDMQLKVQSENLTEVSHFDNKI